MWKQVRADWQAMATVMITHWGIQVLLTRPAWLTQIFDLSCGLVMALGLVTWRAKRRPDSHDWFWSSLAVGIVMAIVVAVAVIPSFEINPVMKKYATMVLITFPIGTCFYCFVVCQAFWMTIWWTEARKKKLLQGARHTSGH